MTTSNPSQPPRPAQQRPPAPRPSVTNAEAKASRTFSKQLVVGNLGVMAAMTGYGMWSGNGDTAAIVGEYGMWSFAALAMYMSIGYGDHRLAKGAPGLMDILTLVVTRGRGTGGPGGRAG